MEPRSLNRDEPPRLHRLTVNANRRPRLAQRVDLQVISMFAIVTVIAATTLALLAATLGPEIALAQAPVASPIPPGTAPGAPATVFYPALADVPLLPNEVRGVSRVVYSPDGTTLTVGNPNGIYLYAAQSLQGLAYINTGMAVTALAYSPDSSLIASGSFTNTFQLWDVRSAGLVREMSAAMGAVTHLAFSPDGQQIASASEDGHIRLWNMVDGTLLRDLTGHNGAVWTMAFSPDGSLLASGGVDGSVRVWQVATGATLAMLVGSIGGITSLAFAPDGNSLAFASGDGLVRVWDVRAAKIVRTLSGHRGSVTDVAFSPDGGAIASISYDGTGILWSTVDGTQIRTLQSTTGALSSESIDPTGTRLAVGAVDGAVEIWSLANILTIQIPAYATVCSDKLGFIGDVTIPDGSILSPGTLFYKSWRVQNTGTCPWGPGYRLAFILGSQLGAVSTVAIPPVQPGGVFDIAAPMFAPAQPGAFRGLWQMLNPAGQPFGPQLFTSIIVPAPVAVAPPPLADITASAPVINAGDSVTIRARVDHVQAAWLDGDPVVNNARDKTVQLCNDATFTLVAALRTGEQIERSVTVAVNGTCATPKADLTIREMKADRTNPRTGQTVRFTARIRNQGGADANNFDFVWQPSGSSRFIQIAAALSLPAGQETNVAWDFTFNAPGTFSTKAIVDSNNAVDESDKDNNSRVLTIFVAAAPAPTTLSLESAPVPSIQMPLPGTSMLPISTPVPGLADLLIRLTTNLPFPLSPAQPGQVQVNLKVDVPNAKVPNQVKFTVNTQDTGDTDLSNLGVWFRPFEGGPWANVATGITLQRKTQTNISFDYTFAQPGTYAPLVVIQGVEGAPSATIQIQVAGAVQKNAPPGNSGGKGKNNGKGRGNGNSD